MVAPSIPDSNLLLLGPSCDGKNETLAVLVIATMAQGRPGGCGRRLELLNGVSHGICLKQPMLRAHDQFPSSAKLIVDNILQGQHPKALPCRVSGDKTDRVTD